ncbi:MULTISPECIES: RNaseH domain-containing protein [unclassified Anabaena]|uniref:RNaseH domain-containing protein n=1 Tax=unclassified Anabaena TaxID=2619674 RepID=UPI0039C75C78
MTNNFVDETELEEDLLAEEEDEETEGDCVSDTLYIQQCFKSIEEFPLAFTVPDNLSPIMVEGYTLSWTKVGLQCFKEIQKGANVKNLPYASLRGFLQVVLEDATRIEPDVGLSKYDWNYAKADVVPEPFVYLTGSNEEEINKALRPIINDWFTNHLRPFAEEEDIPVGIIDRLEDLHERRELLQISQLKSQVLPWSWSKQTGTTQPKDPNNKYAYRMLADYVARQIAGKVIFPGLGPIKRTIFSNGTFTSGVAELITDPISLEDTKGKFSFVVSLKIINYPSFHQPLLQIEVSKRRWLTQLKAPKYDRNNISGFIFSQEHNDRAFSYQVKCERDKNSKNGETNKEEKVKWVWKTDTEFEILRSKLNLGSSCDGQEVALGSASTNSCKVLLTYRNGLQDNSEDDEETSEKYGIETGVPEIDKLDAFEAIAKILQPLGIEIFQDYTEVKSKHKPDDTASRMINLPTLLGGVLEALETDANLEFTPKYLDQLNDQQIDDLLNKYFSIRLEGIDWGRKALQFKRRTLNQTAELKALIQANQTAIQRLYPNERPLLFIFYESQLKTEAKLLQKVAQLLWGKTLEIEINHLPKDTHGPREGLPGKQLNAKERSNERIKAWESTAQQIKKFNQPTFCLIMARQFYPNPNGQNTVKPDDKVNKPSTRKALAMAGFGVQFLLPIENKRKTNGLKLADFFHRMQSALKDLLFAHSGRIDDIKEKVDKYLQNISPEARPKEIISVTIERKQKGRVRGKIENTFLPIAMRLNVDTGKCEFRCAYEKGNSLETSPWESFANARAFISQLTPIKLGNDKKVCQTRFMEFVKQIISESVEAGKQPLVMIDYTNCVQLWSWLADSRINVKQINLGQEHENMEVDWQGARIIRIRQGFAPGFIEKKARHLIETSVEDTRTKEELKNLPSALEIPSASSAKGLFRLSATKQTGCVAYLSVARELPHQYTRGQSCYRSTDTLVKKTDDSKKQICNKAGLKVHQLTKKAPFTGRWPTPNPLEIVVTLRQPEDNADDLAALVESLRYGFGHYSDWTALPAPLFFERVVRDYISDFTIEDEETESD